MSIEDCCVTKLAMSLIAPLELVWLWWTEGREDRDIEAQRRRLARMAAPPIGKIETSHDDLLGGQP